MQKVNIFVGSAALLWSTERRGNQLLIGHKTSDSDQELDVALDFIPTSERADYKEAREFWYQSHSDFEALINQLKPKVFSHFKELYQLKNYDFCYVITAPGGLFSNVATGLLLDFLSRNNIDFRIIVLNPGYRLLHDKREVLIDYIRKNHSNILLSSIGFSEEEIKIYGKKSLYETYNELTGRMIKYINNATF